ncbi:LytR/AlgR family response regulator transcription factor [Aquimarina pacifica]|uniref:LytR/AlgR family response regulator transcription factor n=1 Tax=Aquimarina pacifica TaxID=1296415 RepID=UPI000472D6E5|nr:LytTR family DNA-binding domain-containing protein [Aquimarina pacifica]
MKAIILEHELVSAQRLTKLILEIAPEIKIIKTLKSVKEAALFFSNHNQPDLIFADVQFSDGLVFEVFEKFELKSPIIITTAFSKYAIRAIKISAIAYILKPLGSRELREAIMKAKHINEKNNFIQNSLLSLNHNLKESKTYLKKILIGDACGYFVVNVEDIIKCRSEKNYTIFFLKDGKEIVSSKTLKEYEKLLIDCNFIRVHKSNLINLECIKQYLRGEGGSVILSDGSEVEVSRRKKGDLLTALSKG